MCEFLSWTEYKGKLYYLTNFEINTRNGKKLRKKLDYNFSEEIKGHGAIKEYFGLPHSQCIDHECTNFSTPNNFPSEIVEKIKRGEFSEIGIAEQLLTQSAWAEYEKIRQSAWAEYKKITQSALAEYEKIRQSAWAEHEKIRQPALAEYKKIRQSALAEYEKIRQPAWAEYEKIRQPAWAEYEKIRQSALAEYEKIRQPAWAEYEKIRQSAFWNIFSNPNNRIEVWK